MELVKRYFGLLLFVFLTSCLQDETPVPALPPGDVTTKTVNMESDYRYQIYFNLELGEEVGTNNKTDWDLGFECSVEGWHIILNTSKLMYAAKTNTSDFSSIKDTMGNYTWKFDGVTGHLDSTAIGSWMDTGKIYLINRGVDERGIHQGFTKIIFNEYNKLEYKVEFADITEDEPISFTIPKFSEVNFINFSFDDGGLIKKFEPNSNNWDLLFTTYSESLYDGEVFIPYLVNGVQINRFESFCTVDDTVSFEELDLERAVKYDVSSRIDQPGYKWKSFSLDAGSYVVNPKFIYIIKSNSGLYYKLRFVDFYNDAGEKGNPKFEYQQL